MWIETLKDLTLGITSDHVLSPFTLVSKPPHFWFDLWPSQWERQSAPACSVYCNIRESVVYIWHAAAQSSLKVWGCRWALERKVSCVLQYHSCFSFKLRLIYVWIFCFILCWFLVSAYHSVSVMTLTVRASDTLTYNTVMFFLISPCPPLCFSPSFPLTSACCVLLCPWVSVCRRCLAPTDLTCISVMSLPSQTVLGAVLTSSLFWWDRLWTAVPMASKASRWILDRRMADELRRVLSAQQLFLRFMLNVTTVISGPSPSPGAQSRSSSLLVLKDRNSLKEWRVVEVYIVDSWYQNWNQ